MVGGEGYWAKFEDDCELTFYGSEPVEYIDLEGGWNMIGTIDNKEKSVTVIKNNLHFAEGTQIYTYDPEDGNYVVESDSLKPGLAYWVKASSAFTIRK